jgi:hypothetical protein
LTAIAFDFPRPALVTRNSDLLPLGPEGFHIEEHAKEDPGWLTVEIELHKIMRGSWIFDIKKVKRFLVRPDDGFSELQWYFHLPLFAT